MATPQEIIDRVGEVASGPEQVTISGESVKSQSLEDLMKAANWLAAVELAQNPQPAMGLRFTQLEPPGGG